MSGGGPYPSGAPARAPPRRRASQRPRSAGALMTPTCISPSRSTPSSVPKRGTPRMKLWVPSMGATYQRTAAPPASPPRVPQRLAHDLGADPGAEDVDLATRAGDGPLRRQVGVGDALRHGMAVGPPGAPAHAPPP